jgi:hypothetical protein
MQQPGNTPGSSVARATYSNTLVPVSGQEWQDHTGLLKARRKVLTAVMVMSFMAV